MQIAGLFVGQPQTMQDERGAWRSAIFRRPVASPLLLALRGLVGDQVADTEHHGSPDQALCCHALGHYAFWNERYTLTAPEAQLGPGSVGENWTLTDALESAVCIGDTFAVGSARVQVSAPRFPCIKQERKLRLPGFLRAVVETGRTGFYLRVLTPGFVQAGDRLLPEARPHPDLTIERLNTHIHHDFDPDFAHHLLTVPALGSGWRRILRIFLDREREPRPPIVPPPT